MLPPPEGGWGWVVVGATFFITALSLGTTFNIGIIFDELIGEFGCSKAELGFVASIAFGLQCLLGPLATFLVQRFNVKTTVAFGCTLISISFITSAFAPNVTYLYFSFGLLGGTGMAMLYLPLLVIISFYFNRRRSLTTALAFLGGHVGAFTNPYLIRFLISSYSWRGAVLIVGAIVLNSSALSLLLRTPVQTKKPNIIEEKPVDQQDTSSKNVSSIGECDAVRVEMPTNNSLESNKQVSYCEESKESNTTTNDLSESHHLNQRFLFRQMSERASKTSPVIIITRDRQLSMPSKVQAINNDGVTSTGQLMKRRLVSFSSTLFGSSIPSFFDPTLAPASFFNEVVGRSYSRQWGDGDVLHSIPHNICKCNTVHHSPEFCTAATNSPTEDELPANAKNNTNKKKNYFQHFSSSAFTAFVVSNFLLCLSYNTPGVFVTLWGNQLGISKDKTTLLLSLIGLGNIVGRPLLALSADRWVTFRVPLFALMLGTAGAVTTITPMFANIYFLAFFIFQYGFLVGASQTLLAPILADIVPLSELAHALAVLFLGQGLASVMGPPLLALLPSYELTISVSGVILIASAVVLIGQTYAHKLFEHLF